MLVVANKGVVEQHRRRKAQAEVYGLILDDRAGWGAEHAEGQADGNVDGHRHRLGRIRALLFLLPAAEAVAGRRPR
ncbi:MAG: hypothetical protein H0U74_07010, partial [Bradymonadaceae bacterium]|nr:hypothetical protein [Lujinxingiaceae bacterium]